jgi:hypothetical protein
MLRIGHLRASDERELEVEGIVSNATAGVVALDRA